MLDGGVGPHIHRRKTTLRGVRSLNHSSFTISQRHGNFESFDAAFT